MLIYSHNPKSEGAKELKDALGIRRIKNEGSTFRGGPNKVVINWGSANLPDEVSKCKVINSEKAVSIASDKLKTFDKLSKEKVSIPDFTTDAKTAMEWVAAGATVVARTVLRGSSGAGIVIMEKDKMESFTKAPLYTKYVPKKEEFRIHVLGGKVISEQKKALRNGWIEEHGPPNYKIRNLDNGFVFIRNDIQVPKSVREQAIAAVKALGLDFGAVDVIYNEKQARAYVIEVNTAPGLEGQTVTDYAKGLEEYV